MNDTLKQRITSIDVLRAFALFGIILVHSCALFIGSTQDSQIELIDRVIAGSIAGVFVSRASCIFTIMFGISFYLLLRKPSYSSGKFIWRCFLLMLIGLAVKVFYWPDALMWYGICGMVLVLFRNMSNKGIVMSIVCLYILAYFISSLKLGKVFFPDIEEASHIRYAPNATWKTALAMWPSGVKWYFYKVVGGGIFYTLANFALGYLIGRLGWIEVMDKKINLKVVTMVFLLYILFLVLFYVNKFFGLNLAGSVFFIVKTGRRLFGAFFYSIALVYIYNNTCLNSILKYFESYGRLGLTNYVTQSVVGVIVMCHLGVAFMHLRFVYIVSGVILFYLVQAAFSYYWLLYFKNGPMEYLWRCATERKWLPFKKTRLIE